MEEEQQHQTNLDTNPPPDDHPPPDNPSPTNQGADYMEEDNNKNDMEEDLTHSIHNNNTMDQPQSDIHTTIHHIMNPNHIIINPTTSPDSTSSEQETRTMEFELQRNPSPDNFFQSHHLSMTRELFQQSGVYKQKKPKPEENTTPADMVEFEINEIIDKFNANFNNYLNNLTDKELINLIEFHPMRLSHKERIFLEILECALDISEYTNNVDIARDNYAGNIFGWGWYSRRDVGINSYQKEMIIKNELAELKDIILGLYMAYDFKACTAATQTQETTIQLLDDMFEVMRRFKISNHHLLRTTYQKLMHVLQDVVQYNPGFMGPNFKSFKEILTVGRYIKVNNLSCVLQDEMFRKAVFPSFLAERKNAQAVLIEKYGEKVELLLFSISDGLSSISATSGVIHVLVSHLCDYFKDQVPGNDLSIKYGERESTFSHGHVEQFQFVYQSLSLWWNTILQMPLLWYLTDHDFLGGYQYQLVNTGQGLQRMMSSPNVYSGMSSILGKTKSKVCAGNYWRGLSVIHMGDVDVPNPLFFIDKYSQMGIALWIIILGRLLRVPKM